MKNMTEMMIERFAESKNGAKSYGTYDAAVKAAEKEVDRSMKAFGINNPCRYVVVYVPTIQRFSILFLMAEWLNSNKTGGYLGHFAARGHFSC